MRNPAKYWRRLPFTHVRQKKKKSYNVIINKKEKPRLAEPSELLTAKPRLAEQAPF